jgi:predicted Zn-dependent protease
VSAPDPAQARLAMLRKMAEQQPDQPFPRYGLAMELKKLGRKDEAREVFEALMKDHPSYVASYLMAGGLLVELDRREEAAQVLERGMEVARAANDEHTLGELAAAKADLGG